MLSDLLNKKIDAKSVLEWLSKYRQKMCSCVVLMFFCSPLIEMVVCLFNRIERVYPLVHYRKLVVDIIHPISVALGLCVLVALIYRAMFFGSVRFFSGGCVGGSICGRGIASTVMG